MVARMKRSSFFSLLLVVLVLMAFSSAIAQDNPVEVRLEIYVVSEVTADDGTRTENFTAATSARPGQIVEYRLFAVNNGDTTLPPGTVVITGPVPDGTRFMENSATPTSERLLTEYSVDGLEFSEPPVFILSENGGRRIANPEEFRAVRWTLLVPMEPAMEEAFIYRVVVE